MEYTLKLNSTQIKKTQKAVELLMRLKLGQYQELVYTLGNITDPAQAAALSEADSMLSHVFYLINRGKLPSEYKDDEWKCLYDIFQTIRKAIHDSENPDEAKYEVVEASNEPLPECTWR